MKIKNVIFLRSLPRFLTGVFVLVFACDIVNHFDLLIVKNNKRNLFDVFVVHIDRCFTLISTRIFIGHEPYM